MKRIATTAALFAAVAFFLAALSLPGFAAEKIKITKADDLPRYTYKIDMKATAFIEDSAAYMKLAHDVQKDLLADLDKYDIQDNSTLQGYYAALGTVALLDGKYDVYLDYLAKRKALESKEANALTMGLVANAWVIAKKSNPADMSVAFKAEMKKLLDPLPWDKVQDNIKSGKGSFEMMSKNMTIGGIEAGIQPVLDKSNGELNGGMAMGLISTAFSLKIIMPLKDDAVAVYTDYVNAHEKAAAPKPDIWADREVTLTDKDGTPVVIGVWDSGVDTDLFPNNLWTNTKEIPNNNIDDDKNGFVDDVHGIAWGLHSDKEIPLLFNVGDVSKERPVLQRRMKGLEDIGSNIDSPEAKEVKDLMQSLPKDSVKPVFENIGKYGNYCHGTHVSGISVRNNALAKILAARLTFDYHMMPELPTEELARKDSAACQQTVAYFKKNGVRVVNMSWGNSLGSIEGALIANNWGKDPEERKAQARKLFEISKNGLFEAIKNAPEILFVTSAGNSDNNVKFDEFYPSSFELPNVLTVGAVDQAGDETSFTSFGKVDVYADGFEVMSYVPGGDQMKLSGTSMSSPNVMNLAGKLFAKNSKLTSAQVRDLIIKGCDEKQAGDHKLTLINPKKSFELLAAMK
jgi:subtilisin family serine protease